MNHYLKVAAIAIVAVVIAKQITNRIPALAGVL
jgi:hypothetical protein